MSESVQFWLDNKMSAGIKVAAIGDQVLVSYREKYYVVEQEAAHSRGGKALRYSKSSLPTIWKRALKGEDLPAETLIIPADDALPVPSATKPKRVRKKSPPSLTIPPTPVQPLTTQSPPSANITKLLRSVKITELKPVMQAMVTVVCPQCNHRHELPPEKGKNGKPFFMACDRCKSDFAVRFVPVMVYQAQVAGFR
jgi:hypothetical protein